MKKILLFILVSSTALLATAQNFRINGYASYVFDDSYDSYYDNNNYYTGKISGGFQGGAGIEFMLSPQACLEVMYLHRSMDAPTNFQAGIISTNKNVTFNIKHDYVLVGTDGHIVTGNGVVEGYGGLFGGALFANLDNPENGSEASATRFAWCARLGCNIWPMEGKLGVKIQAQLISAIRGGGGEFYFGPYGNPVGLSTYSTLFQFGLGGGLTYRFGR